MRNRHLKHAGMILGAILAAILFFAGGAALRLLMGPISLGPFTAAIEDSVNRSLTGLVVRFDQAVLEWSRTEGQINLVVLGTNVFDATGRIVAQAPRADLDFDAAAFMSGEFALKRFSLEGVQLTAIRDAGGTLRLGFSQVESDVDLLQLVRDTLQRSSAGGGSLEAISVQNARLAFSDEMTGAFVVAPDFAFAMQNDEGRFSATLDAEVEISGMPAQVTAHAVLGDDGVPVSGSVDVRGLDLAAVAANSARFAALASYPLRTDFVLNYVLSQGGGLAEATFELAATGSIAPPALGETYQFDTIALSGSYDAAAGHLSVENAEFAGPQGSGNLTGEFAIGWNEGALASLIGDAEIDTLRLVAPELFAAPLLLDRVRIGANYDAARRAVTWRRLTLAGPGFSATLAGTSMFPEGLAPAVSVTGTIAALSVENLLHYWPLPLGEGARAWMALNVDEATIGPTAFALAIPGGVIGEQPLPEEALTVTFPIAAATARYMRGLTPLSGLNGQARLTGKTFDLEVSGAEIGPLAVAGGTFRIPDLHVTGPPSDITAHVSGSAEDVLALIDMDPLGYPTRFNLIPAEVEGRAEVDLDFMVPLKQELTVEDIRIGVAAVAEDLALPLRNGRTLTRGETTIAIDNDRLTAEGTADINTVPMLFQWREDFHSEDGRSTQVTARGTLDAEGRERLGVVLPDWITGPIPTVADFVGDHFEFETADVRGDLTEAEAKLTVINLDKVAGTPASGAANVSFEAGGGMTVRDIAVMGDGLEVQGELSLDNGRNMVRATFPVVRVGDFNDFAATMDWPAARPPQWRIRGNNFDARLLVGDEEEDAEENAEENAEEESAAAAAEDAPLEPISVDAVLENAVLRDGISIRDITFRMTMAENERLTDFYLDAKGPAGDATMTGRFANEDGQRSLTIESDEAGEFVHAFAGFTSLQGGAISVRVLFPTEPVSVADYTGTMTITDFTVVDQPFIARLLSIGSLDGPLRLLQGQGIAFSRFEAPFSARGDLLTLRDGRATGPALGVSFQGMVDRDKDAIDVNGSLVPVYTLNSMLGMLPVVGGLLVSKEGEGVIGLTYQARGPLDEPLVSVNPLSVLTPGIFRRLFEFGGPVPPPPLPPAIVPEIPGDAASAVDAPQSEAN